MKGQNNSEGTLRPDAKQVNQENKGPRLKPSPKAIDGWRCPLRPEAEAVLRDFCSANRVRPEYVLQAIIETALPIIACGGLTGLILQDVRALERSGKEGA